MPGPFQFLPVAPSVLQSEPLAVSFNLSSPCSDDSVFGGGFFPGCSSDEDIFGDSDEDYFSGDEPLANDDLRGIDDSAASSLDPELAALASSPQDLMCPDYFGSHAHASPSV